MANSTATPRFIGAAAADAYRRHLRNEYVLMRLIGGATNSISGGPRIDTRTARQISKSMSQTFSGNGNRATGNPNQLLPDQSPEDVGRFYFDELKAGVLNLSGRATGRAYSGIEAFLAEYDDGTGVPNDRFMQLVDSYSGEFDRYLASGVVPMSPYAPTLQSKDAFLTAGTRPLFALDSDISKVTQFFDPQYTDPMAQVWAQEDGREKDACVLYTDSEAARKRDTDRDKALRSWKLTTNMDRLGLSVLRPFMTTEEYRAVAASVTKGYDIPAVLSGKQMDAAQRGKVLTALNYLSQSGKEYEIAPGRRTGEIVVNFGPKESFTLVSLTNPGIACARYYNDGVVATMQCLRDAVGEKGKKNDFWTGYTNATATECLNFLKYCQGDDVTITGPDGRTPMKSGILQADVYSDDFWDHVGDSGHKIKPVSADTYKAGRIEGVGKYGMMRELAPTCFTKDYLRVHIGTFNGYTDAGARTGRMATPAVGGRDMPVSVTFNYSKRTKSETAMPSVEAAYNFMTDAVGTARDNFQAAVGMDDLVERARLYNAYAEAREAERAEAEVALMRGETFTSRVPDVTFEPSADPDIASLQQSYWDILTGAEDVLLKPEYDKDDYSDGEAVRGTLVGNDLDRASYHGTPEEKVRAHLRDMTDGFIGKLDCETKSTRQLYDDGFVDRVSEVIPHGPQFNPVNVARYMTSKFGQFRNKDDLLKALRLMDFNETHLIGVEDDFLVRTFAERLIKFDEGSARPMMDAPDEFTRRVCDTVYDSIVGSGATVRKENILIDHQGVVRYTAARPLGLATGTSAMDPTQYDVFTGEIGRVLAPDANGMVRTDKYCFVPGYIGNIKPNRLGENLPWEERVVLKGYEQVLSEAIRRQVRSDLIGYKSDKSGKGDMVVGDPVSLNSAIRQLYDTRYELDFLTRTAEDGMSAELRDAIIRTNASRVRFPNEFMEGANRVNLFQRQMNGQLDTMAANDRDPSTLTGCRNIAILESPGDGIFDPSFTGNGGAQGVRYLAEGAEVRPDGTVARAELTYVEDEDGTLRKDLSKTPRCAIIRYLESGGRCPDFDAADRTNMEGNGLLHCLCEARDVRMAQVNVGGWTFEDGIVVSSDFARKYQVRDEHGVMRDLMAGDKMTEHGNKGVIAIVVDRNMSPEEAADQHIEKLVELFRANPELDVVKSPYSGVSRFNAGTFTEANAKGAEDLILPDGRVAKGAVGTVTMTILEQTADSKTHHDADIPQRMYGPQAGWALDSADCPAVIQDSFASNTKALTAAREYLISIGMDLTPDGQMRIGYRPHDGERRNVFEMRNATFAAPAKPKEGKAPLPLPDRPKQTYVKDKTLESYLSDIADKGGFLEVPFKLSYPRIPGITKDDGIAEDELGTLEEIPWSERSEESRKAWPGKTYKLPIISSYLRSGMDYGEGDPISHDYTNRYSEIIQAMSELQATYWQTAYSWRVEDLRDVSDADVAKFGVGKPDGPVDVVRAASAIPPVRKSNGDAKTASKVPLDEMARGMQDKAQRAFNKITGDIVSRRLEHKRNMFRTGLMANKQAKSATAIWTPDPRVSVADVGMNPDMASSLGLREGDYAMVHRDPILQESGIRYLKVKLDPRLAGISVNPAGVPGGMDGDFDGDTAGVHKPKLKVARAEAMERLSVRNNLLDKSARNENGDLKLFIAGGQDIAAGIAADPALKSRYEQIERWVNRFERDGAAGKISEAELGACRDMAVKQIDRFVGEAFDKGFGRSVLSYESPQAHFESMVAYVEDGCKGKTSKVGDYARFAGYRLEWADTSDKNPKGLTGVTDERDGIYSQEHRDENCGMLAAKNFQQQYTGFAGAFSIRAMTALLSICPNEASRLSKLATQGVLQVKHDRTMADTFENILSGPARNLWHGYKMERCIGAVRTVVPTGAFYKDADGELHEITDVAETETETWRVLSDAEGNPIKATKAEFIDQFMEIYAKDMGLDVNPDLLHKVADAMEIRPGEGEDDFDAGKMHDLEGSLYERTAASMQRVAYAGNLKDIVSVTARMMLPPGHPEHLPGLFEVPNDPRIKYNYNKHTADAAIMRENLARKERFQDGVLAGKTQQEFLSEGWTDDELRDAVKGVFVKGFRPIVKSDCLAGGEARTVERHARIITPEQRHELLTQHTRFQRPAPGRASPDVERAAEALHVSEGMQAVRNTGDLGD